MKWRIIMTDTEGPSGVAPECEASKTPCTAEKHNLHTISHGAAIDVMDYMGVYDCCPHPHIECWTNDNAVRVLAMFNQMEVDICQ